MSCGWLSPTKFSTLGHTRQTVDHCVRRTRCEKPILGLDTQCTFTLGWQNNNGRVRACFETIRRLRDHSITTHFNKHYLASAMRHNIIKQRMSPKSKKRPKGFSNTKHSKLHLPESLMPHFPESIVKVLSSVSSFTKPEMKLTYHEVLIAHESNGNTLEIDSALI